MTCFKSNIVENMFIDIFACLVAFSRSEGLCYSVFCGRDPTDVFFFFCFFVFQPPYVCWEGKEVSTPTKCIIHRSIIFISNQQSNKMHHPQKHHQFVSNQQSNKMHHPLKHHFYFQSTIQQNASFTEAASICFQPTIQQNASSTEASS